AYLKQLTEQGVVILAGRTLNTDASSFGIVILQADSEATAHQVMQEDPAVKHEVMHAELFPYRIALMAKPNE
ncbi:YciI family protein, partial [Candidatus Entotheonella palauensis]|uniref:YciI family protein n=1 Tax=Candidatus Entotheonella palauensis TaxID=93172 RepID=UPI001C4E153D